MILSIDWQINFVELDMNWRGEKRFSERRSMFYLVYVEHMPQVFLSLYNEIKYKYM